MDNRWLNIEEQISQKQLLVIGDVMIDAYLFGGVDRISPEAPVPIVNIKRRNNRLGGAANVALNVQSLGAVPILCAVVGNDDKGREFLQIMESLGLSTEGMIMSDNRITTVKYRIIGNNVQLLRMDEEIDAPLCQEDEQQLSLRIDKLLSQNGIDAIIFEDYDKGVISPAIISQVVRKAMPKRIPITVDPKRRNFQDYHGVTLFKPNLKELKEGTKANIDFSDINALTALVEKYILEHQIEIALITLSERGVLVVRRDQGKFFSTLIPAHFRNIVDVSGAGDTVISVATLAMTLGVGAESMAAIANLAGGLVCEEIGVVPIDKVKLLNEISRLNLL